MRESAFLEFKSKVSNTFLKTVSAYANFHDGEILFGIDDTGTAVGLDHLDETCLAIENRINDCVTPRPRFSIQINPSDNTIRVHVQEGPDKPYLYNGKAYRRSDSSTVEVDRIELNRLVLEGENLSFEELDSPEKNLEFKTLSAALHNQLDISDTSIDVLKTLGLMGTNGFNRAAAILSDKNSYPGIDIIKFGASINEILDRTTVEHVSVLQQLSTAMEVFNRYLRFEMIEGATRFTKDLVPREAFREAIANGLVHRTWDINSRMRVSIFPDRVEICSPGGLPTGLSKEEYLRGRVSVLRNPILAEVFFRLGLIEKFGTGILRIRESYRDEKELPKFELLENSITVTLPFIGSLSQMSPQEELLLNSMLRGRYYSRSELDLRSGFDKSKTIRLLNSLLDKQLILAHGESRARRYSRL
ncbi:ATP-binding protein [Varibaculum sp.]|uniref:ATP-binding protein n=1 Tax=Varibaculum sp. TaxID=1895474 RepID=UPI0025F1D042|nr:ATP-binding protein [Varibaculum sp.]